MINEHLPFQTGGKGISPSTQRLIAIAYALGCFNSENQLFNLDNNTLIGSKNQAPYATFMMER